MAKQKIIRMIERAGFEAVERDTIYKRVEKVAALATVVMPVDNTLRN